MSDDNWACASGLGEWVRGTQLYCWDGKVPTLTEVRERCK